MDPVFLSHFARLSVSSLERRIVTTVVKLQKIWAEEAVVTEENYEQSHRNSVGFTPNGSVEEITGSILSYSES